jgi:uncharacterized protein YjeT (DUF2065 family)
MTYNPNQAAALVEARLTELRREMGSRAAVSQRSRPVDSALRRVGWVLVAIGLRLALPRGGGERRRALIAE